MIQVLQHRGPDGQGIFLDGALALGHRRLSIIDLECGAQPMTSASGRALIIFNGEIYNFLEWRRLLQGEGYRFKTNSDTEVILALYEKFGEGFLERLEGMFALALWDCLEKKLILARDRIGIKPLYYAHDDGRIAFASEIKAIHCVFPHLTELNPDSVNSYFTRQYIGGEDTIFKKVKKVPPGSFIKLTNKQQTLKYYWQPRPLRVESEITDAAEELDARFDAAVKGHLISDVPMGLFLSGGIDSGCLLAYAAANSPEPIQTFSVGFGEESEYSETRYARILAKSFGSRHHEIQLGEKEMLAALPHIIRNLDEPLADYAILPTYLMSRFAAEHVKVVLSGEGADEIFGGYKRYHLYSFLDSFKIRRNGDLIYGPCLFKDNERQQLLRDLFTPLAKLPAEQQMRTDKKHFAEAGQLNSVLYTDLRNWLVDDLLMKVDKMGMLASIEARVPYLDHHVVEFVLTLGGHLKVGWRARKRLLKKLVASRLPNEILNRPKHGFTVPVAEWLRGPLLGTFHDAVMANRSHSDWLDHNYVERLLAEHRKGKNLGLKLWSILIFCLWCQSATAKTGLASVSASSNSNR